MALPHSAHRCCCPRWPSLATEWKLCGAASSDLPYLLPCQTHTGSWQRQNNRGSWVHYYQKYVVTEHWHICFSSIHRIDETYIGPRRSCRGSFGAKQTLALNKGRGIGDFPAHCLWSTDQKYISCWSFLFWSKWFSETHKQSGKSNVSMNIDLLSMKLDIQA